MLLHLFYLLMNITMSPKEFKDDWENSFQLEGTANHISTM